MALDDIAQQSALFQSLLPTSTTENKRPSINEFRSSFSTDLAKPAYFDVIIFIPPIFTSSNYAVGIADAQRLQLRCEAAELPGRTIATHDFKTYGPVEKMPYMTTYNDITLTFICSSSMIEKSLFDLWIDYINPSDTWNFRFKNNYCTKILINQYDSTKNYTYQNSLIDAFPVSVNQLDLNWNDDGYHKLSVTFAYTNWENTAGYTAEQVPPAINANNPFGLGYLKSIIEAAALTKDIGANLGKSNPFGALSAVGAASSLLGSTDFTLSKVLNSIGAQDTYVDSRSRLTVLNSTTSTTDVNDIEADL